MMGFVLSHAGAGGPFLHRLQLAANLVLTGGRAVEQGLMSYCLATTQMAGRLGLPEELCDPLRQVFTRWDAKGVPEGVGGEQIAPPMRLFHLADTIEVFHRAAGVDAAVEVARARRGKHFQSDVEVDMASAVFAGQFACWGFLDLWRNNARGSFSAAAAGFLAAAAAPLATALRHCQARTFVDPATQHRPDLGPVVLTIDGDLRITSRTAASRGWLDALLPPKADERPFRRALAHAVDMEPQSLYTYFASKNALYDRMFADGNLELARRFADAEIPDDARSALRAVAGIFLEFAAQDQARYQLLFLRTIPGFQPSPDSYALAVEVLASVRTTLARAGLRHEADFDLWTAVVVGLAGQQLANDPGGDRYIRLIDGAVTMFADHILGPS